MSRRAKRQWANIALPNVPDPEPSPWFDEVLKEKDARQGVPLAELAKQYNEAVQLKALIDEQRSHVTALLEALDRRILEDLESQGLESFRAEGQTFSPRHDLYPRVVDRDALHQWLKDTDQEYVLTVNHQNLKTMVKEAFDPANYQGLTLEQRQQIPAGAAGSCAPPPGVEAFAQRTLGRVKQ